MEMVLFMELTEEKMGGNLSSRGQFQGLILL